ncbi:retrovirus-related pol polyprotein from transposon TNT 1-94 [Tanacetum coccineum]
MTVVGARETVGGQVVQQSGIQCFNCKEFGHFAKECKKPKCDQSEWLADTDEEIDEQELEAHYSYMAKIQEVPNADSSTDYEPLEQIQKANFIEANASLTQELKECKSTLAETSRTLGESNSIRDSCLVALQNKQTEFKRYKAFNDRTVDYDKLEQLVDQAWVKHSRDHFRAPTAKDMEILIKTCLMPLALKTQNDSFAFVHELKKEMHDDLKYIESP